MVGFIAIVIIYAVVVGCCFIGKIFYKKIIKKEEVIEKTSSKIYYITNKIKPKKKKVNKPPDIAIKGSIIEKDKIN